MATQNTSAVGFAMFVFILIRQAMGTAPKSERSAVRIVKLKASIKKAFGHV